jgi:hypothetical protein
LHCSLVNSSNDEAVKEVLIMAEESKEAKPKKRMTATQAAASIGPMVKEFITGTLRARAEGKQKIAYTFIVCHHEEIYDLQRTDPL